MDVFDIITKEGVYTLQDKINEWEFLLSVANELGVYWDKNIYDPIGLQQAIEDYELKAKKESDELRKFYFGSLGVK
jgi:hypothetical protein